MNEKKGACCWSINRWFLRFQQRTGITLALAQIAFIALGSTRTVGKSYLLFGSPVRMYALIVSTVFTIALALSRLVINSPR